ncbi:MAG: hypothetical protein RLY16_490 [Bacteroidota bacterium]|jgi:two-component system LytT family response regulator
MTNPMRAIIIDDETHCIKTLQYLLQQYPGSLEVIAHAGNGQEGMQLIQTLQPDLIFLDIQMPYLGGLEMLEKLGAISAKVIFTTAYDQYAIRAIKLNALDYLLKPIDKNELFTAIDKAKGLHQPLQPRQIQEASAVARGKVPEVIAVSDQNGLSFIKMQQIVLLEAESSYTIIHLLNGQKHTISKSLHHFEELLDASHFFRAHKSYIINLKEVVQYLRGDAGEIILSNNMHISLSRSKKDEFLNLFSRV